MQRTKRFSIQTDPRLAFTLVEMLVSISLLAVLVVLIAQLLNTASSTTVTAGKRSEADKSARLVLDRFALDFSRIIQRPDIDYSFNKVAGNDSLGFFCETPGFYELSPTTDPPSYSRRRGASAFVAYQSNATTARPTNIDIRRLSRGLVWADDNSDTAAYNCVGFLPFKIIGTPGIFANASSLYNPDSSEFKILSDQVFRLEYCFLLKDGTLSVTPWISSAPYLHTSTTISDIVAVVVAIAVLDPTSRVIAGDITKISEALPDAVDGKEIAGFWTDVINHKDAANPFPPPTCPLAAASAVRVYQRFCYLGPK